MKELEPTDPTALKEGRYTLRGLLGEGSMGRTFLADCAETETAVAVKALYPSRLATLKDLELFMREADILRKLSHPQIPAYIDAFSEGEEDARCYFLVQTYVRGVTLRDRIVAGARWEQDELVAFAISLLEILAYMHGCDPPIVHRDIKPDNIILDEEGRPTLVDFGAVREVVRLTMGGGSTIIGSYGYMPPEQLMGHAVAASDLYSVGVTLLEMLTRQTPQDLHGVHAQQLIDSANVTENLRRVFRGLLAPRLDDRYPSAEAVLDDLRGLKSGGPIVHASAIETAIAERQREEERALKAASSPGFAHLGYITLVALIVASAIYGIGFVITTLATNFETGFLFAGLLSGSALFVTFLLLGTRYIHDSWLPPDGTWQRATARVTRVEFLDDIPEPWGPQQLPYDVFEYEFKSQRGTHEYRVYIPDAKGREEYYVDREFAVYFDPKNPDRHDRADFPHDPHDAMPRLFDPTNVHTPE